MSGGRKPKAVVATTSDAVVNTGAMDGAFAVARSHEAQAFADVDLVELLDLAGGIHAHHAFGLVKSFASAAQVRLFKQIRESKRIKDLPIRGADGQVKRFDSIREACAEIFGRTYQSMMDAEERFDLLGDAYEQATRLRLNSDSLRATRALPPEQIQAVRQAIASGSTKAEVMSVIEDLAERVQQAEEKTLDVQAELQVATEAREKQAKRIDKLEAERRRYNKLPPDQQLAEMQTRATAAKNDLLGCIHGALRQACLEISNHGEERGLHDRFLAGLVGDVQFALDELRAEFRLPDTAAIEAELPDWLKDDPVALKAAAEAAQQRKGAGKAAK